MTSLYVKFYLVLIVLIINLFNYYINKMTNNNWWSNFDDNNHLRQSVDENDIHPVIKKISNETAKLFTERNTPINISSIKDLFEKADTDEQQNELLKIAWLLWEINQDDILFFYERSIKFSLSHIKLLAEMLTNDLYSFDQKFKLNLVEELSFCDVWFIDLYQIYSKTSDVKAKDALFYMISDRLKFVFFKPWVNLFDYAKTISVIYNMSLRDGDTSISSIILSNVSHMLYILKKRWIDKDVVFYLYRNVQENSDLEVILISFIKWNNLLKKSDQQMILALGANKVKKIYDK